jgi:transcriptional regulator with XRE-family HTH domain
VSATHQLAASRDFPELVRSNRLRAGLTQQQLADLSALSVRAVRDLEAGRVRRPRQETVRLLAGALRLGPGRASAFIGAAIADPVMPSSTARSDTLLGRDAELALLQDLLEPGDRQLISIVGLPGVGKSRLADEVAQRCVELGWTVTRDPRQLLTGQPRPQLLVVDSDLVGADLIAELTTADPALRILRCAAAPLGRTGEQVLPLAGLTHREPTANLAEQPAIALFCTHARRARPGLVLGEQELAQVAEVCRLLDGVPAAIGNAADWALVLSWAQLLQAARHDPLGIGSSPSEPDGSGWQASLVAAVAGLSAAETALLRVLATRKAWTLEALCHRLERLPVELAKCLHQLSSRGLISSRPAAAGPVFCVPHVIERALARC